MFVILLVVIVMITQTFVAARALSLNAKRLTEAVCLAEDIAEVSKGAKNIDEETELIEQMDQTRSATAEGGVIKAKMVFDGDSASEDEYRIKVVINSDALLYGTYVTEEISVYFGDDTDPIYVLNTGGAHEP